METKVANVVKLAMKVIVCVVGALALEEAEEEKQEGKTSMTQHQN